MAYNKAKAEKEWLRWKEAEEKKLRELGVDEETIQRLHTYDWAQFNILLLLPKKWVLVSLQCENRKLPPNLLSNLYING